MQNDFFQKTREGQITIGQSHHYNKNGINQLYNDFEIFNFGEGVFVDAGVLCITGDIEVDPKTGSQYILENGEPIKDKNGEFKKPEKTISSQEYWENYFKLNPELKPSKIIYGNFLTRADESNQDLEDWAKSKNIFKQKEEKIKEFENYEKSSREVLKKIFTEMIQKKFDKES